MNAGREMDALIAEKVMGWSAKNERGEPISVLASGAPVSPYSTDIASAWSVLAKISLFRSGFPPINDMPHPSGDRGMAAFYKPVVKLEWYEHDGDLSVSVGRCKGFGDDTVHVSTYGGGDFGPRAAEAICLAALKCLGVNVDG